MEEIQIKAKKFKLAPTQILALGFAAIIIVGGVLLTLPFFHRDGVEVSLINGLFTSTSATCVTGLVPLDTFSTYTFWGQLLILVLIQIGGLGFMGIAIGFSLLLGSKIGISKRILLMESIGALQVGGVVRTMKRMLIGTFAVEGIGAVILSSAFVKQFGLARGIWFGIFHSISAFCNAGFDLMGEKSAFSSLVDYSDNPTVIITVSFLIILGGIGFIVWADIWENKFKWSKYKLHSKIMLVFTLILLLFSSVFFFFSEKGSSMEGMGVGERLLNSFFCAVSPRTAGFNSIDYTSMSEGGRFITMLLMFIGAGSGSTGGGIKVTTFVVLMLSVYSYAKNYRDLSIFKRRLTLDAQKKAFSVYTSFITLIIISTFVLVLDNPTIPLERCVFEGISAIGTVGLSMGVTAQIGGLSKLSLMGLMYIGRLGSISVAMAIVRRQIVPKISFPDEKISVG